MANKNLVNEVIPAQVIVDATTGLNQVFTLLKPYLIDNVTTEQINSNPKLGEKSEPYVDKSLEYAGNHPNTVPRRCNIAEAKKDFNVFEILRPLEPIATQLSLMIHNTRLIAGSEAIDCANDYYKSIKQDAEDGVAEAIPIYTDLKQRYEKVGKYVRPKKTNLPA
jgi:hypothetical protein